MQLLVICVYIYLFTVISVAAFNQWLGHFKVSSKRRILKQCAAKRLNSPSTVKSIYDGVRVSGSTDECESLLGQWNEEPGFEYAKLMVDRRTLQPSVQLHGRDNFYLNVSGIFSTWARMDLHVAWPERTWSLVEFIFNKDSKRDIYNWIKFSVSDDDGLIQATQSDMNYNEYKYEENLPGTKTIISFISNEHNSIQMLFDGKPMLAWDALDLDIDQLTILEIYFFDAVPTKFFQLQGVEFIGK